MKWIDQLERSVGRYAISHLIRLVAMFNVVVFIAYKLNPAILELLQLDVAAVMQGEVWRLFTFAFIPSVGSPLTDWLWGALYIWFLWWMGDGLEQALGSFRLNLYYLLGLVGTWLAAFLFGANFGGAMLNSSLFFAFAYFYPDTIIYVFFILPMKLKWLAWFSAALLALGFLFGPWGYRGALLLAFANYWVFFGRTIYQDFMLRREVAARRQSYINAQVSEDEALHRCEVCGRTEITSPELEFRVAKDGTEYCSEHLGGPKLPG